MVVKLSLFRIALLLLLTTVSCGKAPPTTPNDAAPVGGTIVATGSFGGTTVTGTVTVYSMGSNAYIIRLVDFNAPAEAGLQIIAIINTNVTAATITLRASTGNQNYNFTSNLGNIAWSKIVIRSTQNPSGIGEAPLRP